MSEIIKANAELLKRQMETKEQQPKPVAEVATAVLASTTDEPPQRIPESEQRQGRVVQRATLGDLDTSHPLMAEAVAIVHSWAERKQNGHDDASLVLVGPYGTGKTHIARAVLWSMALYDSDGTAVCPLGQFYTGNDLVQRLDGESSFHTLLAYRSKWSEEQLQMIMTPPPVLVIDDVGGEKMLSYIGASADNQTAELRARYFDVINHCYERHIGLVITSNLSLHQLETHLGGRCWDRLCEMAPKGFMFDLTGVPSWRQKVSGR